MPIISIIVPVYNVESYICQCLDSIISQTFRNWELLLIDDGSTDNSGAYCDFYARKDNRIRVFHKENEGVSSARNYGLREAKGKYIYFCDSDDYIESTLLEECICAMESNNADIVRFWPYNLRPNDLDRPKRFVILSSEEKLLFLTENVLTCKFGWEPWNGFYKTSIIKDNKILFKNYNEVYAEDLLFSCEYYLHSKLVLLLNKELYHYRQRDTSLMGTSRGVIKINEINNLSFYFYNSITDEYIKSKYFLIHRAIINNQLYRLPKFNLRNLKSINSMIEQIKYKDFFNKYNEQYFTSTKNKNFKEFGWIKAKGINIFNKYLYKQNFFSTKCELLLFTIEKFVHRLFSKIYRIIKGVFRHAQN